MRIAALLTDLQWPVDMIVPVPLHARRLRERGYNQAEQIAIHAAQAAGIPCVAAASQRVRFTETQVGLNRHERLQNVTESFASDASLVQGKTILIVDDVKTTGATLAACAQPMLNAGAKSIYALTVTAAT
ncbi:MAG: ComF family protein, partial [Anaerolineae bacterium]|nr:ComF family protein [Anaerolineae bacterium]